jgi:hypothetical protein
MSNKKLNFFQNLAANNPALVNEAKQNNGIITRAKILEILNQNTLCGQIETGGAIWLASHISAKFTNNPDKDRDNSNLCKYLRNLTEISEGVSCYPLEKSVELYDARLAVIATHLYQMHQWLLNE